eukprot:Selendium_serpulae@DN4678_c0_g1_i1.p2
MGGDGGSIPKRVDVVRTAGWRFVRNLGGMGYNPNLQARSGDERLGRVESKSFRMSTCALTQERLRQPVVACRLGNLYNKLPLVQAMVAKKLPPHLEHISSLRVVREVKADINTPAEAGEPTSIICPISSSELTAGGDAVLLWACGCVMSAKSVEAVGSSDSNPSSSKKKEEDEDSAASEITTCLVCGTPYDPARDVIHLAPDYERFDKMQTALDGWKPTKRKKANGEDSEKPTKSLKQSKSNEVDNVEVRDEADEKATPKNKKR